MPRCRHGARRTTSNHHQEDPGHDAGTAQQWTGCAPELLQILASCDVLVDQSLLCGDWRTWQRQQVSPKSVTSCLTNGRVFGHDLGHSAESQAPMLQSSLEQQSSLTNAQAGHGVVQREEVQRVLRLVVALWVQVHPCRQVSCSARISGSGPGPRTRAPGEGERRGGVPGAGFSRGGLRIARRPPAPGLLGRRPRLGGGEPLAGDGEAQVTRRRSAGSCLSVPRGRRRTRSLGGAASSSACPSGSRGGVPGTTPPSRGGVPGALS